jgi:hypothetical protein
MEKLKAAIELKSKYNQMELEEVAEEFSRFSGQKIPQKAIEDFRFVGLNNVDFLTSDWLNRYSLKNLFQYEVKKEKNKIPNPEDGEFLIMRIMHTSDKQFQKGMNVYVLNNETEGNWVSRHCDTGYLTIPKKFRHMEVKVFEYNDDNWYLTGLKS